jgi:DNA helicase-2/ATP-dependent DNA helicase PcrA
MQTLEHLNPQQRQAVTSPPGPILVLAGPGSGKTRVLSHRIAYLICDLITDPGKILAVTFTNKAAREMGSRVQRLLDNSPGGGFENRGIRLGTFHATCAMLLRREAAYLPVTREFVIFDDADQQSLTRQVIKEMRLDPKQVSPSKVHGVISQAKNELIDVETFTADTYFNEIARRVYERYQALLVANNAVDFDDLLFYAVRLLQNNEDLRRRYQHEYPHILVDEFQDTNMAQYALLQLLASDPPDLFVVGDPDQSIYRWRGADYRNVGRFKEDYPGAHTILLEQNYRSTQTILDVATAVIDRNRGRVKKHLFTERGRGEPIVLHEAYDEADEASYVIDTIAKLALIDDSDPRDCAVMYRTNAQSRALEEAFLRKGLPYRLVGAQRFYGRREVKDLIAYLRLVHNPVDKVSLLRIVNTPSRGIGAKTIESLLAIASSSQLEPYEVILELSRNQGGALEEGLQARALRSIVDFGHHLDEWLQIRDQIALVELINKVLRDIGYQAYLVDGTEEGAERWENIEELRAVAEEYTDTGLVTFLEHVALISDQDTLTDTLNAPTLLTLHAAKGLEFQNVIIIGLDDGVLPHLRSFDDPEAMAEERRLFYVGVTRAMDRLILVRAFRRRIAGPSTLAEPSRYIDDLPPDLVEGVRLDRFSWENRTYQAETNWDPVNRDPVEPRFKVGMRVQHDTFGEGIIINTKLDRDDEEVTISFENGETKHLVASLAGLEILD